MVALKEPSLSTADFDWVKHVIENSDSPPSARPAGEWSWTKIGSIVGIVVSVFVILGIVGRYFSFQAAVNTTLGQLDERFVTSDGLSAALDSRLNPLGTSVRSDLADGFSALNTRIDDLRDSVNTRISGLESRIESLDSRLNSLETDMRRGDLANAVLIAATRADEPQSLAIAVDAIRQAQEAGISIPPEALSRLGSALIGIAFEQPEVWDLVNQLMSYRSGYAQRRVIFERVVQGVQLESDLRIFFDLGPLPDPERAPTLRRGVPGAVSSDEAARFEDLGANLNPEAGVPVMIVENGAISIDGKDIRHTIISNVEVRYSGGPVKLENVVFVNCRFVFDNTAPSHEIGNRLLSAANEQVTFSTTDG